MGSAGCPAAARACASMRATSNGWFLPRHRRLCERMHMHAHALIIAHQQASVPPMMPAPTSSALVSLAAASPWKASLKLRGAA